MAPGPSLVEHSFAADTSCLHGFAERRQRIHLDLSCPLPCHTDLFANFRLTPALLSDLLLQDTILLLEVVDYALLISVDPASK